MVTETHGAFIQLKGGGHAFIDGIPDTCEHDYSDDVFITVSGKTIHWHTYRNWARYTSEMRNRLIFDYQNEVGDPIQTGTSECRKCKKIFHPPIF